MKMLNSKGLMFATLFACAGSAYAPTDAERVAAIARADKIFNDVLVRAGYNAPLAQSDNNESLDAIDQYMNKSFDAASALPFARTALLACQTVAPLVSTFPEYKNKNDTMQGTWVRNVSMLSDPTQHGMYELFRPISSDPVGAVKNGIAERIAQEIKDGKHQHAIQSIIDSGRQIKDFFK